MSEFWIVLAFISGFLAGWGALVVFSWAVKREALSITNRGKQLLSTQKFQETKGQTADLMIGVKEIMSEQGDIKEKLPKLAGLLAQYPDASEKLLSKVSRFL